MIRTINGDIDSFGGMVLAHEHLQIDLSDRKGPQTVLGPAHEADITAAGSTTAPNRRSRAPY